MGQKNPTSVPILTTTIRCQYQCCQQTFVPLEIAFAHKNQGAQAGPVPEEKPLNAMNRMIIDPGTRSFE